MTNQTKMIIITSNEDLINQLSLNKDQNTHIIDLDQNNLNHSISKNNNNNNNLLDLTVLAQLSELNSNNDQIYKRVLDSPKESRSKMAKTSKKNVNLICVICGDNAIGFNYDALTCASCKAFFRRNAQYNLEQIRCLTGEKKCFVSHNVQRKCQRCRLEKCFTMGMRKDFILSEEEKQKRRQRLQENRQISNKYQSDSELSSLTTNNQYDTQSIDEIDRLLMDIENDNTGQLNNIPSTLSDNLSIEDWSEIESIRLGYSSIFGNENTLCVQWDTSDRISALVSWSQAASQRAVKLINFFQQLDEFENLNSDDRFTLIKYNLLPLCLIQKCIQYNPLTRTFMNISKEDVLKRTQFFKLCYQPHGNRETYLNLLHSLSIVTEQDSTLIYLLLILLLFSKGLSMNENEPLLNDVLSVNRAQSHYTRLTWNYLLYKNGEKKTTLQFTELLRQILRIQSFTVCFRDIFRAEIQSTDILERMAPLMQAVLNIP